TLGFGAYVAAFGSYDATYGSLGAVVVMLTWLYLSSYVLLFGAELNSEFEHQTEIDTTAGKPEIMGERGAWVADHVAEPAGRDSDEPARTPEAATQPAAGENPAARSARSINSRTIKPLARQRRLP